MSEKHKKPDWLDDIQNRSWEPELFISGGVIFTLFQITGAIQRQSFLLLQKTGYIEPVIIANFLVAALNALIFGFGLHLALRGFWVASVCLSYVFPKGIQTEKVDHYASPFKRRVHRLIDTSVDLVVWMESASSIMFFLSFLFFSLIISVLATLIVITPNSSLLELGPTIYAIIRVGSYILLFLGFIYAIDFLTMGFIKRQKKIAKLYYPIYWLFSILTLSFLYRSAYYTLVTNIKRKWLLATGIAGYLLVALAITQLSFGGGNLMPALSFNSLDTKAYLGLEVDRLKFDTRQYDNTRKPNDMVQHVSIQSDIVQEKYLKLFIVHQKIIERLMDMDCAEKAKSIVKRIEQRKMLNCYREFYEVYIDDARVNVVKWRYYTHPKTGEEGILAFVPIDQLSPTEHIVEVKLNVATKAALAELKRFGMKDDVYAYIPFWKDSK